MFLYAKRSADHIMLWTIQAHPRRPRSTMLLVMAAMLLAACAQGAPATTPALASTEPAATSEAAPTAAIIESPVPTDVTGGSQAAGDWTVAILQDGQAASAETGQVLVARAPFTLRVTLPRPMPVKLNVNADDANFIALQPGYLFTDDCLDALCTGMDVAEERLNPTQVLFVDPQSTHYLYYQGPDDHRWSRATVSDTSAVFERDVALLNDVPIQDFGASELYLLLFVDSANLGVIDPGELKKITLLMQ